MKGFFSAITKYKFGVKFRILLFISLNLLIIFHLFILTAPFIKYIFNQVVFSDLQIKHLQTISNSLANITVTIILIFIVVEGQRSIRAYITSQRKQTYAQVEKQLLDWFKLLPPKTFDSGANTVRSEPANAQKTLRNFKVAGSHKRIIDIYKYNKEFDLLVQEYCDKVHFELTCYPREIIYGIHIEFDDFELSKKLYDKLEDSLSFSRQSKEFKIDDIIPKKPGWIFITRTIELEGDEDKDFSAIMTHTRHFVELVGHCYDYLYDKVIMDIYLKYQKTKSNNSIKSDS